MSLPITLAVLDLYPLRRPYARGLLSEKIPFLLLALVFSCLGVKGYAAMGHIAAWDRGHLGITAAAAAYSAAFYLGKTAAPFRLSPLYEMVLPLRLIARQITLSALVVIVISAALWKLRRPRPAALAAWVHYLGALAPTFAVVPFVNHIAADRYAYLSCLGFPLLIAGAWRAADSRLATAALALVIGALGLASWEQTHIWHDSVSLWSHATALPGRHTIANMNLEAAIVTKDEADPGILALVDRLRRDPASVDTRYELGVALANDGRLGEAIAQLREAREAAPGEANIRDALDHLLEAQRRAPPR